MLWRILVMLRRIFVMLWRILVILWRILAKAFERLASFAAKRPLVEPALIESLPEELIVSCLARVSRLYYPTLSLVSKRFSSLLASPEIYKTRSLLGCTESCLYVCLGVLGGPNLRWFTLCRKPEQTLASKRGNSSGNILVPVKFLDSPTQLWSYYLSHAGPCIYANRRSRGISSFLDCRTHTWHDKPHGLTKEEEVGLDTDYFNRYRTDACTVENITYKYSGEFMWSDNKGANWRKLEGLDSLLNFARDSSVRLVDFGGKMLVLWDEYDLSESVYKGKMIWCALIAFERRNNYCGKWISGKVEWIDAVLKVPHSYDFLFAIAATV